GLLVLQARFQQFLVLRLEWRFLSEPVLLAGVVARRSAVRNTAPLAGPVGIFGQIENLSVGDGYAKCRCHRDGHAQMQALHVIFLLRHSSSFVIRRRPPLRVHAAWNAKLTAGVARLSMHFSTLANCAPRSTDD